MVDDNPRGAHTPPGPAPRLCNSVLEAIGNTPLIKIERYMGTEGPTGWIKFEAMNPGGSSKDRSAREMLTAVERERSLPKGTRVIISTSGNMGVGLAMMCAYRGYRLLAIVDPKVSPVNEKLLRVYGAKIIK